MLCVANSFIFKVECVFKRKCAIAFPGYQSKPKPRRDGLRLGKAKRERASTRDRQVDVDGSISGKDTFSKPCCVLLV